MYIFGKPGAFHLPDGGLGPSESPGGGLGRPGRTPTGDGGGRRGTAGKGKASRAMEGGRKRERERDGCSEGICVTLLSNDFCLILSTRGGGWMGDKVANKKKAKKGKK